MLIPQISSRYCFVGALHVFLAGFALGQSSPQDSLGAKLATHGWVRNLGLTDLVASGTITEGGRTERLVIKVKAGARQRSELPDSGSIVVINEGKGFIFTSGRISRLKVHENIATVAWMFPTLTSLMDLASDQILPLPSQPDPAL